MDLFGGPARCRAPQRGGSRPCPGTVPRYTDRSVCGVAVGGQRAELEPYRLALMAAAPPVTAIDLMQFSEIVDNARTDGERGQGTGLVATSNDGQPDVALKGSLLVWDADHLAWWERSRAETEAAVRANRNVAVMVRNIVAGPTNAASLWEASIVDDADLRERVWQCVVQVEKDTDPEKNGVAVLVRIDRVRAGRFDIQRR